MSLYSLETGSLDQFKRKALSYWKQLITDWHKNVVAPSITNIMLVTHGGFIFHLGRKLGDEGYQVNNCQGISYRHFGEIKNGSVTLISIKMYPRGELHSITRNLDCRFVVFGKVLDKVLEEGDLEKHK